MLASSWHRAFLAALLVAGCGCDGKPPIRIGVMLWQTGPGAIGWEKSVHWAADEVNAAGGVAGRKIELVEADLGVEEPEVAAERFAADESVVAVVGAHLFRAAPIFVRAKKPVVSPSSTSGDIFRAFGGKGYAWRTVESDVAQIQVLLALAARDGARKVALAAPLDEYGATFFDWFGFFAVELGLTVTDEVRYPYESSCENAVDQALAGAPDVLVFVPGQREAAVCAHQRVRAQAPATRILFADWAQYPGLIDALGAEAEGIEGTAPIADPASGFDDAYRARFGTEPHAFAANTYDALTLLAYGLERSHGVGGEALDRALREIVTARGEATGWNAAGVARALTLIRKGVLPDVTGATGALSFDEDRFTDVTSSVYGHWRVEQGAFRTVETFVTSGTSSVFRTAASDRQMQDIAGGSYVPPERHGLRAVVVATSGGWQNYRHQADALAQYQMLRGNGVPDDRIILILRDDLAGAPENARPGEVLNDAGGPDLRAGAQIDYSSAAIGADELLAILKGEKSAALPTVLESDANDDVYVFLVGHGGRQGVFLEQDDATDQVRDASHVLDPDRFAAAVQAMYDARRYRRLLIVVEACHGGVMGTKLTAPGAFLIAGANPFENSFGANYDSTLRQWLADDFAFEMLELVRGTSGVSVLDAYAGLYRRIAGSHVSAYNARAFGSVQEITVGDFLRP